MRRPVQLSLIAALSLLTSACGSTAPLPPASPPERSKTENAAARLADEAALREAAIKSDTGQVKALLDRGVNVNARDVDGRTPLTEAAYYGRTEVAKLLLDRGADVFARKNDGATVSAMAAGHKEIAEMIDREIRLLEVAGKGDNKTLKELLDQGTYVNVTDPDGRTPLTEAAWNNHVETVKLLLDKGADPNAKKKDGATPLSIASGKGYKETAQLLRKAGAK
jgi:uncharacterized protein